MTPQHDKKDKYEQCRKGEQMRERLVSFGVRKGFLDGTAEPGFGGSQRRASCGSPATKERGAQRGCELRRACLAPQHLRGLKSLLCGEQ